jgi:hypothetical protein
MQAFERAGLHQVPVVRADSLEHKCDAGVLPLVLDEKESVPYLLGAGEHGERCPFHLRYHAPVRCDHEVVRELALLPVAFTCSSANLDQSHSLGLLFKPHCQISRICCLVVMIIRLLRWHRAKPRR